MLRLLINVYGSKRAHVHKTYFRNISLKTLNCSFQYGVLRITDGPCRNDTVAFHSKDAYVMLKHLVMIDFIVLRQT